MGYKNPWPMKIHGHWKFMAYRNFHGLWKFNMAYQFMANEHTWSVKTHMAYENWWPMKIHGQLTDIYYVDKTKFSCLKAWNINLIWEMFLNGLWKSMANENLWAMKIHDTKIHGQKKLMAFVHSWVIKIHGLWKSMAC